MSLSLDTGVLVAAANAQDRMHRQAVDLLDAARRGTF